MRCLLFGLVLWLSLLPVLASAGTVVGVVSERSAAELAAGAHRFLDNYPEHEVLLRTPEQLATLGDGEIAELLQRADALLLAAVFGDQVGRLGRLVETSTSEQVPILAINSDRRLTRLSRRDGERVLESLDQEGLSELVAGPEPDESAREHLAGKQQRFVAQADWLQGRAYYQGRSPEHLDNLMRWLLAQAGIESDMEVPKPSPREAIRYYRYGTASTEVTDLQLESGSAVAIIDLDSGDRPGDRALLDAICDALEELEIQCFSVLSRWGGATLEALERLPDTLGKASLSGILSLQDFTLGGGEGRREVTQTLEALDVPVLKGLRLSDRTEAQWRLSSDGLPRDSVHYKLAMPELQGVSQPLVLAVATPKSLDKRTGVELRLTRPVDERVTAMADRLARWQRLRELDNADKKVALVYYNHPPGRQNVGADNLDVPASLFEMLHWLADAGYDVGELPASPEALHDLIQQRGVNLPQDRKAMESMAGQVPSLSRDEYLGYFETLPAPIQGELEDGPLGYMHARLVAADSFGEPALVSDVLERVAKDMRHLLENHDHPAQTRALDLLEQYVSGWQEWLAYESGAEGASREDRLEALETLRDALLATGIPGLSGWGEAPGRSMVIDERMLFPGLRFGNVFIGPQPPRGWEIDESLLHANTTFPPTHQYIGFYHWLRDHFEADALVYLGRHSTREFLPRRRAGLTGDDYPDLLGGDLPLIYPYIVDGVGEGIQAKRRALGVMISHLTPPLAATELYDDLLELRQLVETWEAAVSPESPTRRRAVALLRERIQSLSLTEEFEREIAGDLGIADEEVILAEVSEDLLVHEAGHYVTDMQESFMPLGLHVFGRDWSDEAVDTMLASMIGDSDVDREKREHWRALLSESTAAERNHWLAALEGRFVPPGLGNDPIRTPEVLPTGRNFHALSGDLIPTRVAWSLGSEMAATARARDAGEGEGDAVEGSEALVLWASDTVRDEGVLIAFGLDMLGVRPRWNSRGIVEGLERLSLNGKTQGERRKMRRDVLFTTSGLFRDLYEDQLVWLDLAVRLALDGASDTIRAEHPQLINALDAALAPLPSDMRDPGAESLANNRVAARWVADTRELMAADSSEARAGEQAALRVFGTAPGGYGAGVNRLASRSSAWEDRSELGSAYRRRMGHAYGKQQNGEPSHAAFDASLARVERTYLGRASHLYGLLDNDDGFDFQGGLSTAVEQVRGDAPDNRVLQHADPKNPRVESLERALLSELRGRNLNPQWIKPLMDHGYAGARTLGSDFLDNLWGWQVTSPEVVRSWVWDEVDAVYFQDSHGLGLDEFLSEEHNVHVKTHMQSIALLAAKRDFWEASQETLDRLTREFAEAVSEHGLPGSGHTHPDHPLLPWVAERLDTDLRETFEAVIESARIERPEPQPTPASIREIQPHQAAPEADAAETDGAETEATETDSAEADTENAQMSAEGGDSILPWLLGAVALLLLLGGIVAGRRTHHSAIGGKQS
ncbi:cobaltochelatase subunit CobN [Vreelandella massiliensis]|uniref:cobaltochelatase subunit CobN n=1 Tax=Vreelandella massiliensis TaxID=1816686 RepID=UPI0011819117|nr:cobaltochelatase subunit CobN [Halomonas massiliensis]